MLMMCMGKPIIGVGSQNISVLAAHSGKVLSTIGLGGPVEPWAIATNDYVRSFRTCPGPHGIAVNKQDHVM